MRADLRPEPIQLTVPFRPRRMAAVVALAVAVSTVAALAPIGRADAAVPHPVTGRLSGKANFTDASGMVDKVVTSGDGRFAAFTASGNDVVPGLASSTNRVYVRDTLTDSLELVSVDAAGAPASNSRIGAITPDGRYVAFVSYSQLLPADTNDKPDVYVRDRTLKKNDLVSVSSAEVLGDDRSGNYSGGAIMDISDDGRYVAFESDATNLVGAGNDTNGLPDIYFRDRVNGTTSRVSVAGATPGNGASNYPSMSADGLTVVFATAATNLVANDTNGVYDIILKHMDGSPTNVRISQGLDANPNAWSNQPKVSANGNLVVFTSNATDLVSSDTNGATDVFVRNVSTSTTTRASVWTGGTQIDGGSEDAGISPDGTRITFETDARVSAAEDGDLINDVYLREGSTTSRQSVGTPASDSAGFVDGSSVSNETVVWYTPAAMATIDTNAAFDAYVRRIPFIGPHPDFDDLSFVTQQRIAGIVDTVAINAASTAIRYGASPEHQVVTLVDLPSFSAKKAPVARLYWAYFKRRPDLGGLNYWINQYATGAKSLQKISLQFALSNEFKTKYGNTTSTQFVTLVYQNVLERQPEPDGLAYWSAKIDAGTSRGQVMTSFSESSEGKRITAPYVDTVLIGLGMIGKIPSKPLFDAAVADVQAGWPREIIVDYVLGAPEYAATL
jgi:Tol biopolymer transport system component